MLAWDDGREQGHVQIGENAYAAIRRFEIPLRQVGDRWEDHVWAAIDVVGLMGGYKAAAYTGGRSPIGCMPHPTTAEQWRRQECYEYLQEGLSAAAAEIIAWWRNWGKKYPFTPLVIADVERWRRLNLTPFEEFIESVPEPKEAKMPAPTKTARRRKKAAEAPSSPKETPRPTRLPIASIEPHPDNPRKTFDEEALQKLAESLKRHDLLQPLVVRPHPLGGDLYQLVCGERRWRAAKIAKLEDVPVTVRELSDPETLELMIVENEDRSDLNPVELAGGLRLLCLPTEEGGAGLTHAAAAERFSHSEAWATNLMRLLRLPKKWQDRIVAGEIPQTFARLLLPYVECEAVIQYVEEEIAADDFVLETRDEFEQCVYFAVREQTRPIEKNDKPFFDWRIRRNRFGRLFKLTDELKEQLAIVDIPVKDGLGADAKTLPRATNVELYDRLQEEAKEAELAKKNGQAKSSSSKTADGKAPTSAELEAKRKEQDEQLARRVGEWRQDRLRAAAAGELVLGDALIDEFADNYAIDVQMHWPWAFTQALSSYAGKQAHFHNRTEIYAECLRRDEDPISARMEIMHRAVRQVLTVDGDHVFPVPRELVEHLAGELEITTAEAWRRAGRPMRERFFKLHTKDQLEDLVEELDAAAHIPGAPGTKRELVEALADLAERKSLRTPKVLLQAAPKPKRKKGG